LDRLKTILSQIGVLKLYSDTSLLLGLPYMVLTLPSLGSDALSRLYNKICEVMAKRTSIDYLGFRVRGSDCDTIQTFSSFFEPVVKTIVKSLLKEGDVFIDVGACVGTYTLLASKIVGRRGLVVALEPAPKNFRALVDNLHINKISNVIAFPYAAWESMGYVDMIIPPGGGKATAKIFTHFTGARRRGRIHRARAVKLDDLVKDLGISKVDLVKIDAEGAELEILRGSHDIFRKHRPAIVAEVLGENLAQVLNLFRGFGYRAVLLEGDPRVVANFLFLAK
jgi:FkbM family methyltransferase